MSVPDNKRHILVRKVAASLLWSILFFITMAVCCVLFIAATTDAPALIAPTYEAIPTQTTDDAAVGMRVASAVSSMGESDVLWGLLILSIAVAVFGSYVEALPGTDSEAINRRHAEEIAGLPNDCPNCGTPFAPSAQFCYSCGQERISGRRLTMSSFIANALPDTLNIDGRFLPTLWALISKPGYLTAEYLQARRAKYSVPLQLYLVITAVFFFVSVNLDFNITILEQQFPALRLKERIEAKAKADNIAPEVVALQLGDMLENYLPLYTFFMVIAFAAALRVLYRRWRYAEHLIFSLHFIAAVLIVWILCILLGSVAAPLKRFEGWLVVVPSLMYLFIALKVVYPSNALWKAIPAALYFLLLFVIYTAISLALGIFLL